MRRAVYNLLLPLAVLVLLSPVAFAAEKASLVLQWTPQAQFAGFFMAQEKGFYAEEGIDLTLISGGPDVLASEYLETGKAEFATMFLSSALQRRATLPVVNVGQFGQHSALMLVAIKGRGIERIEDLGWKKIGLWANEFQIQARALFKRKGLKVTVVPQSDSLDLFMRGGVQAASAMWYNEYHTLLSYGLDESELIPFFFRDYGLDFPEDGIYCLDTTAEKKPELARALVRATARGWRYTFDHPDEALDTVLSRMREARIPACRAHQKWMLARMRDIMVEGDVPSMGILRRKDFERVRDVLLETGFISNKTDFNDFYRGER
ncbi:ABC transporter substrate-binding protein [Pseudodesulfovibrio cashew]|uniref:Thiamine pyrimidine synthase n=1 Tax=Pseudodesulfovibrio cashew TaxID=2678688 RepID=A0A6I6J8A0_9BACT|nr:ABC transporter substrate-binding protein [Pseudodesulfovibrio cashew]QGY38785.1 ABC transporter substrate-binding protein [Pseudodesulfovibrio cashew]